MKNAVRWFEIYVNDMARAKAFYEEVFAMKMNQLPVPDLEMWAFPADMTHYGSGGTLVKMPGLTAGGTSTIVYFASEDCAIEVKRASELGAKIHKDKTSIGPNGFIALMVDTEGNMIGVHSMV